MPTIREHLMNAPDYLAFGPTSVLTGLDVTSKFSAANIFPDSAIQAANPFGSLAGGMFSAGVGMLSDPSTTNAMRLSQAVSPTSSKGLHEKYFSQGNVVGDSKKPGVPGMHRRKQREGAIDDQTARAMALRSLPESKNMHSARTIKEQDAYYANRRDALLDKAKDRAFEGNFMAIGELARKYVDAEGSADSFVSAILSSVEDRHHTQLERMIYQAIENPQKLQRRMGVK
jgi:hypothetical protein